MAFMRQPNLFNGIKTFFFSHLFATVPPGGEIMAVRREVG
jgi:hypothetical protein